MNKPLNKRQKADFKRFRALGFSVRDARRAARLTYSQLAREVSSKLRERSKREVEAGNVA